MEGMVFGFFATIVHRRRRMKKPTGAGARVDLILKETLTRRSKLRFSGCMRFRRGS